MVKFAAHLAASYVEGWEKYYVEYATLRAGCNAEEQLTIDEYFSLWKFEFDKVHAFFEKISRETLKTLISLRSTNKLANDLCNSLPGLSKATNRGYDALLETPRDLKELEKGLPEVVTKVLPLFTKRRQFSLLNVEALRKAAKKCHKYIDPRMGDHLYVLLSMSPMASSLSYDFAADLRSIIRDIEEYNKQEKEIHDERRFNDKKRISKTRSRSGSLDSIYDSSPFDLLSQMMAIVKPTVKRRLVAHRGFHSISDKLERPLENTLAAYEQAWAAGCQYCECDVTLTLDQQLVLCHDENLYRVAHTKTKNSGDTLTKTMLPVTQLTFDELLNFPLKNGSHTPLLIDVLKSAVRAGQESKLVIEIKSGALGQEVANALCLMLLENPKLLAHVAVIMSFDLYIVHNFLHFFNTAVEAMEDSDLEGIVRPKIMFLTKNPDNNGVEHEMEIDWKNHSLEEIKQQLEGYSVHGNYRLDGFYVQYHKSMLIPNSKASVLLKELSKVYALGFWGDMQDPDDVVTCEQLVPLGFSFMNTDIPYDFMEPQLQ